MLAPIEAAAERRGPDVQLLIRQRLAVLEVVLGQQDLVGLEPFVEDDVVELQHVARVALFVGLHRPREPLRAVRLPEPRSDQAAEPFLRARRRRLDEPIGVGVLEELPHLPRAAGRDVDEIEIVAARILIGPLHRRSRADDLDEERLHRGAADAHLRPRRAVPGRGRFARGMCRPIRGSTSGPTLSL